MGIFDGKTDIFSFGTARTIHHCTLYVICSANFPQIFSIFVFFGFVLKPGEIEGVLQNTITGHFFIQVHVNRCACCLDTKVFMNSLYYADGDFNLDDSDSDR